MYVGLLVSRNFKAFPLSQKPPCDRDHDWINFGLAKRHYNLYEIAHATLPYVLLLCPVLVLLQGFWHNLLPNTRAAHTMWPPLSFGEPINSVSRWPHGRQGCRDQSKEQCIGQRRGPRSAEVQHNRDELSVEVLCVVMPRLILLCYCKSLRSGGKGYFRGFFCDFSFVFRTHPRSGRQAADTNVILHRTHMCVCVCVWVLYFSVSLCAPDADRCAAF